MSKKITKANDLLADVKAILDKELKNLLTKKEALNDLDKDFILRAYKVLTDAESDAPRGPERPFERKTEASLLDIVSGKK